MAASPESSYRIEPCVLEQVTPELADIIAQISRHSERLGSKLARFALNDTRRQNLKVVPTCEFIAKFIQDHPEYQDLVVGQNRG